MAELRYTIERCGRTSDYYRVVEKGEQFDVVVTRMLPLTHAEEVAEYLNRMAPVIQAGGTLLRRKENEDAQESPSGGDFPSAA